LLPQSGLALVGALLQDSKLRQRIDALDVEGCPRPEVKHGEVVAAAIGLLCLGKSDFNDIEANTWWTSLKFSAKEQIALSHAHGTSEQYHSEIKTDLDLERLPSGKFATNATMLSLGLVAYNILRLCGQGALKEQRRLPAEERAPLKKKVFRRRLRSVIQDLMYLAAQWVRHANRWRVVFWSNSPWGATWRGLYARFAGAPRMASG